LVMVVSEQGASLPFGKWTCYDTGLQSAMVVRWPGKVKAGAVTDAMVEYVDVLPTFIQTAGGKRVKALDGRSFLPVLRGKADAHKELVYGIMTTRGIINGSDTFGIRSVRNERFKYIWNFTPEIPFRNACVKSKEFQSWMAKAEAGDSDAAEKVRRYQHRAGEELYDVTTDPLEWKNLAADPKYAAMKSELRGHLDDWMKQQGDEGQKTEIEAREHDCLMDQTPASSRETILMEVTPQRSTGRLFSPPPARSVSTSPMAPRTSSPPTSVPKQVYWRSRKAAVSRQTKNWQPALSGFCERAIEITPRTCGLSLNSAAIL